MAYRGESAIEDHPDSPPRDTREPTNDEEVSTGTWLRKSSHMSTAVDADPTAAELGG